MTRPRYFRTRARSPQRYMLRFSLTMSRWRVVSQLAAIDAERMVDELDDCICSLTVGFGSLFYARQLRRAAQALAGNDSAHNDNHPDHFWSGKVLR